MVLLESDTSHPSSSSEITIGISLCLIVSSFVFCDSLFVFLPFCVFSFLYTDLRYLYQDIPTFLMINDENNIISYHLSLCIIVIYRYLTFNVTKLEKKMSTNIIWSNVDIMFLFDFTLLRLILYIYYKMRISANKTALIRYRDL